MCVCVCVCVLVYACMCDVKHHNLGVASTMSVCAFVVYVAVLNFALQKEENASDDNEEMESEDYCPSDEDEDGADESDSDEDYTDISENSDEEGT